MHDAIVVGAGLSGLSAERLEPGEWRELTAAEIAELRDA
jgi:hypothetical protein